MRLPPALLESWMRDWYFDTDFDIGSSGVETFSFGELRRLLNITHQELDEIRFDDSQTLGGLELREAIARRWNAGGVEQVMATHGSSEAIFLVMNALLEKGDEVVVLDPSYHQLSATAEIIGCRLKHWRLDFESGFAPDLEEARKLLSANTRLVVVNFPHNPTGATLSPGEMEELIGMVSEVGAYLFWDAAFSELTYDAPPLPLPNLGYERAVSIGTLSKAYGLPGLRVGWCIAPPEVLERCTHIRDYTTLHLSPFVEHIARRVIEKSEVFVSLRLQQARRNLEVLDGWVAAHAESVEWVRPRGGVSAFLRLRDTPDVESLCRRLGQTHRVLLVPGNCFGYPDFVRLGFGGATDGLREGLASLSHVLTEAKVTPA